MPKIFGEKPTTGTKEQKIPLFLSPSMSIEERREVIEKAAQDLDSVSDDFLQKLSPTETKAFYLKVDKYKPAAERKKSPSPRPGVPLPEGGSSYRSPIIKASRVNAIKAEREEEKYPVKLIEKIKKEGLATVQAQVAVTVLEAIHEYIKKQTEEGGSLAINKDAMQEFIDEKEGEYREILCGDKNEFAENAVKFASYVDNELRLAGVPAIAQRLELLRMVAELSPKPAEDISNTDLQEESINGE
jgi:hypothetical protein